MPRRSTQQYRSHAIAELARQLLYAPPQRRIEAFIRAEHLHDEIEQAQNYPLEFLVFRTTGRRVPNPESITLVGEAVQPDLRLLIDSLSRSTEVPADHDEPVQTTDALAVQLGVSEKTIARWRRAGLRWRWVRFADDPRPRVVFTDSAVACFRQSQGERVEKAAAFSRLSPKLRASLIRRAERLAKACDVSLNQVATHLARRTGRGHETIRQLLEKHDREHPESPMFIDRSAPLTSRQRAVIGRAYRRGVRVATMCERFGRTRSTIYRAVREFQARALLQAELDYIHMPIFDRPDSDEVILRPIDRKPDKRLPEATLVHLPEALVALYDQPIVEEPAIRSRAVRYNFLKFLADRARQQLSSAEPLAADIDRVRELFDRMEAAKSEVVRAGLGTVLSVARRHATLHEDASAGLMLDLLHQGNLELLELTESYDPGKPTDFGTALTNRLLRSFAQLDQPAVARRRVDPTRMIEKIKTTLDRFVPQ